MCHSSGDNFRMSDKWTSEEIELYQTSRNNPNKKEPDTVKCIRCGNTMINACRCPCPNCGYIMEC